MNGSDATTILQSGQPVSSAYSVSKDKLYWGDAETDTIYRSNPDGSGVEALVKTDAPYGIAVDDQNQWLYWIEDVYDTRIVRSRLDGSNRQIIFVADARLDDIAVDPAKKMIYWVDRGNDPAKTPRVRKIDYDGLSPSTILQGGADRFDAIALDASRGDLYVSAVRYSEGHAMYRLGTDGGRPTTLLTFQSIAPADILFDADNDQIFWVDWNGIGTAQRDGTSKRVVNDSGAQTYSFLSRNPTSGTFFTADFSVDRIYSVSADGSVRTTLYQTQIATPAYIARDGDGMLYLTERSRNQIVRFSPEGTDRTIILEGLNRPSDIGIDAVNEKVYWVDTNYGNPPYHIRRANLDGSNVETVYTKTTYEVMTIALDPPRNRIYWIDYVRDRIVRSDLDGSNPRVYLEGVKPSLGIAVRPSDGAVIWENRDSGAIKLAASDGTGMKTLVSGTDAKNPTHFTFGPSEGKLWWTTQSSGIGSSDMDGSNVRGFYTTDHPLQLIVNPTAPLPVEFASFEATLSGTNVALHWTTASETNNAGFYVQRAAGTDKFQNIGFIPGAGTTVSPKPYQFTDPEAPSGQSVAYRLQQVDVNGETSFSSVVRVRITSTRAQINVPKPHPVRGSSTLSYSIPRTSEASVSLYDILGRRVVTLADGPHTKGSHSVQYDVSGLSPGTYFVRLKTPRHTTSRKITVIK